MDLSTKHRVALATRGLVDRLQLRGSRHYVEALLNDARGVIDVRLSTGVRMRLDLADRVQRLEAFRIYERSELNIMRQHIQPGHVVIDAGAHVGYHALHAATLVGPGGGVHAFEPLPTNAAALRANVDLNPFQNITVTQAALSNVSGTVRFGAVDVQGESGWGFLMAPPDADTLEIEVTSVTLDEYAETHGLPKVNFIKMDVQGAERDVLAGAENLLARCRPVILCEVVAGCAWLYGYTPEMFLDTVRRYGYTPWQVPPKGPPMPVDGSELTTPNLILLPG